MRLLGNALALPLALLSAAALSGCDDEAPTPAAVGRTAVDDVVAAADDARAGVLHELADALVLTGAEGTRSFTTCGDDLAPGGVVLNDFVRFGSSGELTQEKATATAVGLLEADGWTVDDPDNQVALNATKGELVLHLRIDPAQVQVDLGSECVETSRKVATEYDDRPKVGLAWSS
ncbi:hypothetical protein [Nocardioides daeguensis]|uniref:Lipoprotein n=1 Tax=Nocardioides daeguensis TaxID=908359 RepID=A0ABP6VGC9_9ACTN|nr:hypothetical protein [Nocardioides daeguensis]MBV6729512.1 hypothetical protein [Nocardioides daeguensis]MCR1771715.1 hypothetical protein [Nocardioides daeguensis]